LILTPEEGLAAGIKVVAAIPVLRWPLAGALISMAADAADVVVMNYVDLGGVGIRNYHVFDKLTDLPALVTFALATLRWNRGDQVVGWTLLAARLAGIALFEIAHLRWALFALPNLFEVWFLFVTLRDTTVWARSAGAPLLAVMTVIKLVQEYTLHVERVFDRYVLSNVIRHVSRWLSGGG
jgi:hypothetical protein